MHDKDFPRFYHLAFDLLGIEPRGFFICCAFDLMTWVTSFKSSYS